MIKVRNFLVLAALLCFNNLFAQSAPQAPVEMADGLRSSGKIYVVVAVLLIILTGLLIYVITIDRKVSRIEKNIEQGKEDKKP
jgi:CcmD family protein